ncbi:hypothetical protein PGB90_000862 [Kerria lacca]
MYQTRRNNNKIKIKIKLKETNVRKNRDLSVNNQKKIRKTKCNPFTLPTRRRLSGGYDGWLFRR